MPSDPDRDPSFGAFSSSDAADDRAFSIDNPTSFQSASADDFDTPQSGDESDGAGAPGGAPPADAPASLDGAPRRRRRRRRGRRGDGPDESDADASAPERPRKSPEGVRRADDDLRRSDEPIEPAAGFAFDEARDEFPPATPRDDDEPSDAPTGDPAHERGGRRRRRRRRGRGGAGRETLDRDGAPSAMVRPPDELDLSADDDRDNEHRTDRAEPDDRAERPTHVVGDDDREDGVERDGVRRSKRRRRRRGKASPEGERRATAGPAAALDPDLEPRDDFPPQDDRATRDDASPRDDDEFVAASPAVADDAAGERRRRRRGSRGGRRKKRGRADAPSGPVVIDVIPGDDDGFLDQAEEPAELPELPDDASLLSPPQKRPRTRGGRRKDRGDRAERAERAAPAEDDDEAPIRSQAAPRRKNVILVNALDPEETRVGVVEGAQLVDFQMTARRHKSFVNDIYRGKVVNLEPAIGAAFVDFGEGRNGFLHTSDVLSVYGDEDWSLDQLLTTKVSADEWASNASQPHAALELGDHEEGAGGDPHGEGENGDAAPVEAPAPAKEPSRSRGGKRMRARPRLPITDLLKKGDSVVVQVTKDAIGDKGPTLTTYISIPGRYLVLMPSMERTGVSRKIEDERERRRLKKILQSLDIPHGMGVIVRTAGIGASKADLQRDLDYLLLLWDTFGKRLKLGRGPAPLYEESDVAIRTIRDLFTSATEAVIVDHPKVYERVREFTEKLMPENVERIKLHDGHKPLFHAHNVEQEFERMFARRIDLPSGGSIVFDQAEALVAIDVNSGKTRADGFDFEDIALKTNLDAVPEIARQIRLRDLGGIIVIDFIDMQRMSSRRQVERAFRQAMDEDRARSKLGRISQFGLLELTRQRLGPGLVKMIFTNCPRCRGSGRVRTVESRAQAILRRLGAALTLKGFSKVEVRAQPEVVDHLKRFGAEQLKELETRHEREIALTGVPDQVEDSVLRYLRNDGREVRPGGRRKR